MDELVGLLTQLLLERQSLLGVQPPPPQRDLGYHHGEATGGAGAPMTGITITTTVHSAELGLVSSQSAHIPMSAAASPSKQGAARYIPPHYRTPIPSRAPSPELPSLPSDINPRFRWYSIVRGRSIGVFQGRCVRSLCSQVLIKLTHAASRAWQQAITGLPRYQWRGRVFFTEAEAREHYEEAEANGETRILE